MAELSLDVSNNFIKTIIEDDLNSGKHNKIIMRFPPEPNGYLHIGHAKSICINFGLAQQFGGQCNLRFDDTNPEKESEEYVKSIEDNIQWLGFNYGKAKYASDYFDKLYQFAEFFINQDLAYVCDLDVNQMREYRGTFTTPGKNSPYRTRSIAENLDLFRRMKAGEFADGSKTLRLKIDMSSSNLNLRDPVIYRIKRAHHIRTLDNWCIYPMYDYTHCISDALECITHSCCSLEFEDHRPLYDWIVEHLYNAKLIPSRPRQIEFSRLELHHTVTSKRKLNKLVVDKLVNGWDDPRMPTLSGMRRRGYTPDGIKLFANRCGVSKSPNIVELELLENSIREDLENIAPRVMAVLNPLKVVLTNYNEHTTSREANFHPKKPELGARLVEISREIYIEADDFMEHPLDGWQRLTIGSEVRLRHSYVIKCDDVIRDIKGNIIELHCSIDHDTLGKNPIGRKVRGVIHWVSTTKCIPVTIRQYSNLFTVATPDRIEGHDFTEFIDTNSLQVINAYIEPSVANAIPESRYQFERIGYYVVDRYDSNPNNIVFNKIVGLKDGWKK